VDGFRLCGGSAPHPGPLPKGRGKMDWDSKFNTRN
jgi:hypothetical protein